MYTYEEQVKLSKSLIPIGRKSTPELINIIKEKVDGLQNDNAVYRQWMEIVEAYLDKYMPVEGS